MSTLARRLPWSQVYWMENKMSEGNKMFTERNWAAAVSKYSDCIRACGQLDITGLHDTAMQVKYNGVLMLAYSNRAEASLRLLDYEGALHDANMALEIDSKHAETLVRKGNAAHGLGFFEKACEAFKCAHAISPEEQSILKLLRMSSAAHEQSRTGDYDLLDFFSRGCTGDIPLCADFVGPVEIRPASNGRWGLFATRSVELGDLLLVSNPLAVVRHKTLDAEGGAVYIRPEGLQEKLFEDLVDRVGKSTLEMARLYFLANKGDQEVEIPSMELFRPGSEWITADAPKSKFDINLICNIANEKVFEFMDLAGFERKEDMHTGVMGLWILPAFANHSCAPNCQHSFVGDTIFFRASGHITEGEELTIQYFTDLFQDVDDRQAIIKNWGFTCDCQRCLFEKSVQRQYSSLSPKHQGWVREASRNVYLDGELDKVQRKLQDHSIAVDEQSIVLSIRSVLDALTSVYVTPRALNNVPFLSFLPYQNCFKNTQFYKEYRDQVLGVYKRVFGKQADMVLSNQMKQSMKLQSSDGFRRMVVARLNDVEYWPGKRVCYGWVVARLNGVGYWKGKRVCYGWIERNRAADPRQDKWRGSS